MAEVAFDTHQEYNRLKKAGADDRMAEAQVEHSKAVADGLASKKDFKNAGELVEAEINGVNTRVDGLTERLIDRFDVMDAKFEARFDAMDTKFEAMEAKVEAMEAKIEARIHKEGKSMLVNTIWVVGLAAGFLALLIGLGGIF